MLQTEKLTMDGSVPLRSNEKRYYFIIYRASFTNSAEPDWNTCFDVIDCSPGQYILNNVELKAKMIYSAEIPESTYYEAKKYD